MIDLENMGMAEFGMAIAAGIAFGIITYRVIRMALRSYRDSRRKRLLNHLDWNDHYNRPRRRNA